MVLVPLVVPLDLVDLVDLCHHVDLVHLVDSSLLVVLAALFHLVDQLRFQD